MNPTVLTEIPIRDTLISDPLITILIVISFIISSITISADKKILAQHAKNFLVTRERNNLFDGSGNTDWWVDIVLLTQLCMMFSINCMAYFDNISLDESKIRKIFFIYFLGSIALINIKILFYRFNGWLFYDGNTSKQWIDSYKTILYYNSFILFFLALLSVYFNLSSQALQTALIVVLILDKILTLYKWFKLFFNTKVGYMLFILQFCALEIVPYFLLYKGLIELNTLLK